MKLKAFDKELLQRVASGKTSGSEMLAEFAVDPGEFWKRVEQLVRKKWLVRDATDTNTIRLGIEGYNQFVAKQKLGKPAARKTPKTEKKVETASGQVLTDLPKDGIEIMQEAANQARKEKTKTAPRASLPKFESRPTTPLVPAEVRLPEAPTVQTIAQPAEPEALAPPPLSAEERCELCKAEFRIRAGDVSRAVYGHCFCGAAYHQDCYASVTDSDGKCIRCGRRFKKHFSREAEEAMKKVRELFD